MSRRLHPGMTRNPLSSYNRPIVVGAVDAVAAFISGLTVAYATEKIHNALSASDFHLYYSDFAVLQVVIAVLTGTVSFYLTDCLHERPYLRRSMPKTIVGGILGSLAIVPLVYVISAFVKDMPSLADLIMLIGAFGPIGASVGCRYYGFVDKYGIGRRLADGTLSPAEAWTLMGQDGTAVTFTPDSNKK